MTETVVEGVTADVCSSHGVWLDKGELGQLVGSVRKAQRVRGKRILRRAALTESMQQAQLRERAFLGGVWATGFLRGR